MLACVYVDLIGFFFFFFSFFLFFFCKTAAAKLTTILYLASEYIVPAS